VRRIQPSEDAGQVTAGQVEALVGRLGADGAVPLFVFDAGYDPIALSVDLARVRAQILVRIRSDRVFFPDPAARPAGMRGRPRRHGQRFRLRRPSELAGSRRGAQHHRRSLRSGRGAGLERAPPPPRAARPLGRRRRAADRGRQRHPGRGRAPATADRPGDETLWLWWAGPGTPDLDVCWRAYIHRFDIEHTLRFVKHTLGWTTPRVRLPEQADRWTWLVVAALHAAPPRPRSRLRLPPALERPCDPDRLTPTRSVGVSADWCTSSAPRQSAQTHQGGPWAPQGQSPRAGTALPSAQEGRLTVVTVVKSQAKPGTI